jgi:hypothetical protein
MPKPKPTRPKPPDPGGATAAPTTARYMVVLTPFQLWLQTQCVKHRWSEHALARRLGVAVTTAHAWWWGRMVPTPIHEERLATLTGETLDVVRDLVWESRRLRATQRAALREAGFASEGPRAEGRRRRRGGPLSASRQMPISAASMYKPTSSLSASRSASTRTSSGSRVSSSSRANTNLASEDIAHRAVDVNMDTLHLTAAGSLSYEDVRSQLISLPRQDDRCIAVVGPEVRHAAA